MTKPIPTRKTLATLSIEECIALGRCECGKKLEGHPPIEVKPQNPEYRWSAMGPKYREAA